jgi:NAD(P)H dehydrogenase (quinone)
MSLKNVIVIGGSGNVGREILASLLESRAEFGTISALKREGVPASEILQKFAQQGVQILEANFKDKASLVKAFKGSDVVISTVNAPAFDDQYNFIDAAIEAKYPLSAQCANPGSNDSSHPSLEVTPTFLMSPQFPISNRKSNSRTTSKRKRKKA